MKLRFSKVHFIGPYISGKAWLRSAKPSAFTASASTGFWKCPLAPFCLCDIGLGRQEAWRAYLPLALGKPALLAEENVRADPSGELTPFFQQNILRKKPTFLQHNRRTFVPVGGTPIGDRFSCFAPLGRRPKTSSGPPSGRETRRALGGAGLDPFRPLSAYEAFPINCLE